MSQLQEQIKPEEKKPGVWFTYQHPKTGKRYNILSQEKFIAPPLLVEESRALFAQFKQARDFLTIAQEALEQAWMDLNNLQDSVEQLIERRVVG